MLFKHRNSFTLIICLLTYLIGLTYFTGLMLASLNCEGQQFNHYLHGLPPRPEQHVWGDYTIAQSFVASQDHLNRIELQFYTHSRTQHPDILVQLIPITDVATGQAIEEPVREAVIRGQELVHLTWHPVTFAPLSDSGDQAYLFRLKALNSSQDNGFAIGYIVSELYQAGNAFVQDNPVKGDLAFRVCYQLSIAEKLTNLFNQITKNQSWLQYH